MIFKWVLSLHLKKWTEENSSGGGNSDDQGDTEERRAESEIDKVVKIKGLLQFGNVMISGTILSPLDFDFAKEKK